MDNQKFEDLMQNEDFVKTIAGIQSPEEVRKAFKDHGVDISAEEVVALGSVINISLKKGGKPLNDDDLSEIAGGNGEFSLGFKTASRLLTGAAQNLFRSNGDLRKKSAGVLAPTLILVSGAEELLLRRCGEPL